ncbi:glycosyltransferase family 4 protein [Planctomycetota bacterium]
MKILHVINYYQEGFGYQENWLPFYQKELGHEVLVATSDYYFPFIDYDNTMKKRLGERYVGVGSFQDKGVRIVRLKSVFDSIGSAGILYIGISNVLVDFMPDVVHVHGATNLCIPNLVRLKKKYAYKLFVDTHMDYSVARKNGGYKEKLFYAIWKGYYHSYGAKKAISKFLPITRDARKWAADKLLLADSDMAMSPLGVDTKSMFYDEEQSNRFRKKHGLVGKTVVVNAGKQHQAKRIDWIIDVVHQSIERGADVFLILVGSAGKEYDSLIKEKLEKMSGTYLRLPFLEREELRTVYSACDIGIWPGMPSNTIQEAMACKVAIILPNDDIVGHLIDGNGLTESQDPDVAADYICSLSQDKGLLETHKTRSADIASKYSWQSITKDLMDIYNGNS